MKKSFFTPSRSLVFGFIVVIFIGTILLMLPQTTVDARGLNFLDALFTSTSATCVTGLVVVDTGTKLTLLGQLIIMCLIQVGGLGFMTFTTFIAILMGRKVSHKERMYLQEALSQDSMQGIVKLVKSIFMATIVIEAAGALLLATRFIPEMGWKKGTYYGIFHSISAFNNAGFDLFGNFSSLTSRVGDGVVNITIASLFILGGLGFVVLKELYTLCITKASLQKLSLHAKCVLVTSLALIAGGTILILLFENGNTLASLDPESRLMASFFQAVTPRTAGFNTLNLPDLHPVTILIIIALMYVGASSGSTGGGIKTTTFATIVLSVISTFKRSEQIIFMERSLSHSLIRKSIALVFVSSLLILTITSILLITENTDLLTALFEATSAFSTVGLTLGITPSLSTVGKIAIIITMLAGRVGPLTLVFALTRDPQGAQHELQYPKGKIIIG